MASQPTAVISYSHDTEEHKKRVLDLAQRLRLDGVDCELDVFHVSPPEGWPGWIARQLRERDFCLVVCTGTYSRRFAGDEVPGTGKGGAFEGLLLRQALYEAGRNNRVIPVVFDRADINHIPVELQGATRYDVSEPDGYTRLHRHLTNQPLVLPAEIGTVRKHLPLLGSETTEAVGLLSLCPDPVPLDVVSSAMRLLTSEMAVKLSPLVEKRVLAIENEHVRFVDRSMDDVPAVTGDVVTRALEAMLDFVDQHRRDSVGAGQVPNALALFNVAHASTSARSVSRTFRVLEKLLKTRGDKHLVLDVARRSIEASKMAGRSTLQAEDEAVAEICGVSWVYQRTGRLAEARVHAERSLALGVDIGWDRNTAFCQKCLGRLARMEAESALEGSVRDELLARSEQLLREAITKFTDLRNEGEVGDCFSLLARTFIVSGRLTEARDAVAEARTRIVAPGTKDYLDLQIVMGDLAGRTNRRNAESIYTAVLEEFSTEDAQKSEIFARAFLQRGRVRAAFGGTENATTDFRRAAEIWEALDDPTSASAHWEIEKSAEFLDRDALRVLGSETVDVRVRAVQMFRERVEARRPARAKRSHVPEEYWRELVREARERLAVEKPEW